MKKYIFCAAISIVLIPASFAQNTFWQTTQTALQPRLKVEKSLSININDALLKQRLSLAGNSWQQGIVIDLPMPNGATRSFNIWQQSIMEPALQLAYPSIKTYTATALDNSNVTAKIDLGPNGFHAMIWDGGDMYFIEPANYSDNGQYLVFYKKNYHRVVPACAFSKDNIPEKAESISIATNPSVVAPAKPMRIIGATHRTYRLALSCTGEYAQAVTSSSSPSKASVLAAMVTTMNRVNGIYERELGVSMMLIANNDQVIYTNPVTDPFSANFDGDFLLDENQTNTTTVIGGANYDIGHIFSTGGGGIASLASVCSGGRKAQGVTGSPYPYGDAYDVDYVAHEMGHQLGADHPFNNCYGNENPSTAYEPGSGSTIMAYAGICGPANDLQSNSDDYFHATSLIEAGRFIVGESPFGSGATCGTVSLGYAPIVLPSTGANYQIPARTAFELQAPAATWATTATLTYSWEGWNKGLADLGEDEPNGATFTVGPIFRSYLGDASGYRSFPSRDSVLRNIYSFTGERTPVVSRNLAAKLTVRGVGPDGYGSVLVSDNQVSLGVTNTGQAFTVTIPNTALTWQENTPQTVSWIIAGTTVAPITASNVDIFLSKDGGKTYPFNLGTFPNNGTAIVSAPNGSAGAQSRIKVKGSANVFYDVSNTNFTIQPNPTAINTIKTEQYNIYPNPASTVLNIAPRSGGTRYNIAIVSVLGQQLQQASYTSAAAIDLRDLAAGVYTLVLTEDGNAAAYYKFVVAR